MTTPNEGGAPTAASIREELGAWVRSTWDPERPLVEWRTLLADAGWSMPSWPTRWHGRGWPAWSDQVVASELAALGAVGNPLGAGVTLAGPTILTHGPDHLRERFLRPILTGEETWCQLFSEPGAGSDLAGLTTSAVLDGDEWVINGQKVWNTSAHHADLGILVARTDSSVPKHRGITFFVISMHQPGVSVRPLRQMNFHASFNEVFFDDARIPKDWVVGTVGGGWSVALTTLAFERGMGGLGRPRFSKSGGRTITEATAEAEAHFETYKWYPQRAGRPDLTVPLAREAERDDDPLVRQRLASLHAVQRVSAWTADRAKAARALGRPPGAEGSVGKLAMSTIARDAARTHSLIAGPAAMLGGPSQGHDGVVAEVLISVPAQSIAGGTDEIQHNILGEKVLGLPREPNVDADTPFNQTRRNATS